MPTLRIAVRKFDPFESAIRRQLADFARAAGSQVRVELEALELNDLHRRLFEERGLSDGSFDITFLATDWLAEAQAAGLIDDLTPHLARAPIADFPQAWSRSLLGLQSFAGGFWGLPYHDGPACLIYRKDLLAEAGLEVPRTWEEFHAAARRLHAPQRGCYGTALALFPDGHNSFYDFCIQVWSRGGEPFAEGARPQVRSPEAVEALAFLRRLAADDSAIAPGARDLDSVKSGLLFCDGRVALMSNWFGFAALGERWEASRVKGRVAVAPLPRGGGHGGRNVSLNVFWVLALASGSRQKDLAWSFMRHIATAAMDKLTTLEGAIGVRRSTWADSEINRLIPFFHELEVLHEHARELPAHPRLADIAHVIDDLLARATATSLPLEPLLQEAQDRIEAIVK
ncbi:MAG TPA: extracellular solute-binding protein [Steroidobacteraceae bacterium]|nr:extracellular solute-binding protein [Steroidobacteraceae bacterium]